MDNSVFRKGMVLAIICCFIGAGVVPGISVKLKDGNDQTEKNDISTSPSL